MASNDELTVGVSVRVKNPDDYKHGIAAKVKDRVGVVTNVRGGPGRFCDYIVTFPALGRRREFKHQFTSDALVVVDA